MAKLPKQYQFIDLSDYGRFIARYIASALKNTSITPIHVTSWFIASGLLAILCILNNYFILAACFLILKSILDAADGELSRLKNTPSYVGRYYDSIADIILNFLFLLTIWYINDSSLLLMILAFIGIQLQGTLYNYYYVILRNNVDGDTTSRIFEDHIPIAFKGETQHAVQIFYKVYNFLYIPFDKVIYLMDQDAMHSKNFPGWFMTLLSTFGLGFQILVIAILLVLHLEIYVIPFFIVYSFMIFVFIGIRRYSLK
ncbi:MAG: CDP-alcohol phosphatidyltransferase family protein [Chitinophagales bacterium]|nr:CDP-alcohol phosphatidyltransferase family protein [Chitinophagales bacterium]